MNRILKMLGFEGEKQPWAELNNAFKLDILKKIAMGVGTFLICLFFSITSKDMLMYAASAVILIGFAAIVFYNYLIYAYGNYMYITGNCISVKKPSTMSKLKKEKIYGKAYMIIETDKKVKIEVPITHSRDILPGYVVTVYFKENNLSEKEPKYYQLISPLAVEVVDTTNAEIKSSD